MTLSKGRWERILNTDDTRQRSIERDGARRSRLDENGYGFFASKDDPLHGREKICLRSEVDSQVGGSNVDDDDDSDDSWNADWDSSESGGGGKGIGGQRAEGDKRRGGAEGGAGADGGEGAEGEEQGEEGNGNGSHRPDGEDVNNGNRSHAADNPGKQATNRFTKGRNAKDRRKLERKPEMTGAGSVKATYKGQMAVPSKAGEIEGDLEPRMKIGRPMDVTDSLSNWRQKHCNKEKQEEQQDFGGYGGGGRRRSQDEPPLSQNRAGGSIQSRPNRGASQAENKNSIADRLRRFREQLAAEALEQGVQQEEQRDLGGHGGEAVSGIRVNHRRRKTRPAVPKDNCEVSSQTSSNVPHLLGNSHRRQGARVPRMGQKKSHQPLP
jgi:hypothetical protein